MSNTKKDITCPHCGKKGTWKKTNSYRPFCSARCKLIDLGDWADEKHVIAGEKINLDSSEESKEE